MLFWPLILSFYWLFQTVRADTYIETSSLLTCMRNSQLTASYFNVIYTPNNTRATFDISAITTVTGKVNANIQVIAYGLNILEKNISLCSLGFSTLCPINAGRLDVDSNYNIGHQYADNIPGIAYHVPDLDARVRVTIYPEGNDTAIACVEAILGNGKTVQTKYVAWPIAAISGTGLIVSGVVSLIGYSTTAAHIASNSLSLFSYFQNMALISMMGVNAVPPIAAAWCQNFQWSMGIMNVGVLKSISNWYVQATGGTVTSILANKKVLSISVQKKLIKRSSYATLKYLSDLHENAQQSGYLLVSPNRNENNNIHLYKRLTSATDDSLLDTNLYNTNEKNSTSLSSKVLVLRGIQRVSYLSNIEITSLFFVSMAFTIFCFAVFVVALVAIKFIFDILVHFDLVHNKYLLYYKSNWSRIIKGSLFRFFLIALPQITVLCVWEFVEKDSAACIVLAAVIFVLVITLLAVATYRVCAVGHNSVKVYQNPAYSLYGNPQVLTKYGFLYVQFKANCYYWVPIYLFYIFLRSIFIATLQHHGKAQAIIIFVMEFIYTVAVCIVRPYMDRIMNTINILVSVANLFNAVFFMIFSQLFNNKAAVPSIAGVVLFVFNAIVSLVLLVFSIVTCIIAVIKKNPDSRYSPVEDDRGSFIKPLEIDTGGKASVNELDALRSAALRGHEEQVDSSQEDISQEDTSQEDISQEDISPKEQAS